MHSTFSDNYKKRWEAEMDLLRLLRHSNIVTYMGACLEQARPDSTDTIALPRMCSEVLVLIACAHCGCASTEMHA